MPNKLEPKTIETALSALPGWAYDNGKLTKTYEFKSFREAMGFIVRLSYEAESANHHPELFNVYSKVTISLSTHDADGQVTQKDLDLAADIERVAWV